MTPAEVARAHALQAIALHCAGMAERREQPCPAGTNPDDAAYLRAYALTCRGVADRLRASPGYAYAAQMQAVAEFAARKGSA